MKKEMMSESQMKQEIREARAAGEQALFSLRAAADRLNSAKNWGIWDMLGGGFITNMIKHSRLSEASSSIERAKRDIGIFQRELRDIDARIDLPSEIDGFLVFADFFFDGLIADYFVQSKISEARRQVQEAIRRVEQILLKLDM